MPVHLEHGLLLSLRFRIGSLLIRTPSCPLMSKKNFNPPSYHPNVESKYEPPEDLSEVHHRTERKVADAFESEEWTLVHAPPSSGKTRSTFAVAAEKDTQIAYMAGRKELYDQAEKLCKNEFDLDVLVLPSPHAACPTFNEECDEEPQEKVRNLYNSGLSGSEIHILLGDELECLPDCPYQHEWSKDFDEYDVLIANPQHAYVNSVTEDRIVVVDEFVRDSFTTLFEEPQEYVSNFLKNTNLPYKNWTDLNNNREDTERRSEAIEWFVRHSTNGGGLSDAKRVKESDGAAHTKAGKIVASLLHMNNLGNDFETTIEHTEVGGYSMYERDYHFNNTKEILLGDSVCVHNENNDHIHLLSPPPLDNAKTVVGLDGTPEPSMWRTVFGRSFNTSSVVHESNMNHYLKECMNYELIQVGNEDTKFGGVKPYHGEIDSAGVDESIFLQIKSEQGRKASLVSTQKANDAYEDSGALDRVAAHMDYANMKSSNRFGDRNLGVVSGSGHYGGSFIKRWSALEGKSAESNEKRGLEKSYGEYGDKILRYMRESQVLQAILRFGREKEVALV